MPDLIEVSRFEWSVALSPAERAGYSVGRENESGQNFRCDFFHSLELRSSSGFNFFELVAIRCGTSGLIWLAATFTACESC